MDGPTIIAISGLVGVGLGGGVRAAEAWWARRQEAASVLSALCAEVEAINRLANHRGFLAGLEQHRAANAALVADGQGDGPAKWLVIELKQNYFATYEALTPKLGLLDPYFADRITRFYAYAKAVSENYAKDSAWQTTTTADLAIQALDNDIVLLQTMHILGLHIADFRTAKPPKGVIDPFPHIALAQQQAEQRALANVEEPAPPAIDGPPPVPGG